MRFKVTLDGLGKTKIQFSGEFKVWLKKGLTIYINKKHILTKLNLVPFGITVIFNMGICDTQSGWFKIRKMHFFVINERLDAGDRKGSLKLALELFSKYTLNFAQSSIPNRA